MLEDALNVKNKNGGEMLCCGFVSRSVWDSIVELNEYLRKGNVLWRKKLGINSNIVKQQISARTKLQYMLPDEFLVEMKNSGCFQKGSFGSKIENIIDVSSRARFERKFVETNDQWLKRNIEVLYTKISETHGKSQEGDVVLIKDDKKPLP